MYESILRMPDAVSVKCDDREFRDMEFSGRLESGDVCACVNDMGDSLQINVTAAETPVLFLRLRWNFNEAMEDLVLGDSFERSYGDLGWNTIIPYKPLYWYFLVNKGDITAGYGVKVRPGALCFWTADTDGVTLWLDVRNGGEGVLLGGRTLEAARVVWDEYKGISAFEAARRFCALMCPDPILPKNPVYGANNWYYAYGDSSAEEILADTDKLVHLCQGAKNRPYMVIDDCWQKNRRHADGSLEETYIGGPWTPNERFPDMEHLVEEIESRGAIPGIWVRFLMDRSEDIPGEWYLRDELIDPSHPDVIGHVKEDVTRICDWGFKLIKHDFSTVDILGLWGWQMKPFAADEGWHFYDRTRTSAEIIIGFYKAILNAAESYDTLIMGCNTIGHLGAGLMHLNRTGDDTSGVLWERTLRMGVNTLAFRMPQHGIFYDIDADCMGVTPEITWEKNRQWGSLLAKSGTSLFVSLKPGNLNAEQEKELADMFIANSEKRPVSEPVDWQNTILPRCWRCDGETVEYDWYEMSGIAIPWNSGDVWQKAQAFVK